MFTVESAIQAKMAHLHKVLANPALIDAVVKEHILEPFTLKSLPRKWEPGGGATLMEIRTPRNCYCLKIKHRDATVENRLESEPNPIAMPSLENEHNFLRSLGTPWAPQVVFFSEREGFQFLATEYLEAFDAATDQMSAADLVRTWYDICAVVRHLYDQGMVHTDLHERNIRFRGKTPVLIDFEEARICQQALPFSQSLDVTGRNRYGSVGEVPAEHGTPGLTCLRRLNLVFKSMVRERMQPLIRACNFDAANPFNLDDFQQQDARLYQSLELPGLRIEGQRPVADKRQLVVRYLLSKLAATRQSVRYLDIGSNLGTFCFEAAGKPYVDAVLGLEAFGPYIDLANVLRFLYDQPKTRFAKFVGGIDRLAEAGSDCDLVSIMSVYHHIANKDAFLQDLAKLRPTYVLGEFAVQDRFYPERGSLTRELAWVQEALGYRYCHRLLESPDYRRPILLYCDDDLTGADRIFFNRLARRGGKTVGRIWLGVREKMINLRNRACDGRARDICLLQ